MQMIITRVTATMAVNIPTTMNTNVGFDLAVKGGKQQKKKNSLFSYLLIYNYRSYFPECTIEACNFLWTH